MTLTTRTLGFLSLIFLLLISSVIVGIGFLLLHQFSQLEIRHFQRDLDRVNHSLTYEVQQIEKIVTDWASWDDTYAYIADRNAAYVKSNLDTETLCNLHINLIVYLNNRDEVVQARAVSFANERNVTISQAWLDSIAKIKLTQRIVSPQQFQRGLVDTPDGMMLFAARPILRTGGNGPVRGVLLMARFVDQALIGDLSDLTTEEVARVEMASLPAEINAQVRRAVEQGAETVIAIRNGELIDGYLPLCDHDHQLVGLLRVTNKRDMYRQGIVSVRYTALAVLLVSALSLLMMTQYLTRQILTRIDYLDSETERIRTSGDTHARINLTHLKRADDEIDRLGTAINAMLMSLESSQEHNAAHLMASERQLRSILETAPAGIAVIDIESHCIRLANHTLARLLQTTVDRLIDAPFDDYSCVDPALFWPRAQQAGAAGMAFTFESRWQRDPNKEPVFFELNGTLFNYRDHDAILLFVRDITQHQQAVRRIADINDCFVHFGPNPTKNIARLTELCGMMLKADCAIYARVQGESVITTSRWQTPDTFPDEIPLENSIFARMVASPQQQSYLVSNQEVFPGEETQEDASRQWQSFVGHPVLNKGHLVGCIGLWYHTQMIPDEETLQVLTTLAVGISSEEARQETMSALEIANKAKSDFLANMSHELRTPLNAIIGYSEMLYEESEEQGYEDLMPDLKKITTAGKHLLSLISDILDLSKIEAGRIQLYIEPFEIAPLLQEIVSTFDPLIKKNQNTLNVVVAANVGEMESDMTKVRQILFNLLSNAAKFTEHGTVTLSAEREEGAQGDMIILRVSDSGIGMSPEQINKLFRPFTQADSSTTRKYGGTGLGLTISRHFCEMLHGQITIESETGKGTTFIVRLPATQGAAEATPPTPTELSVPRAADAIASTGVTRGATILVIDDDVSVREMLQRMLSKEGYEVILACDGREGVEYTRRYRPALIILDVMMPVMDGWSALAALKTDPELSDIPVIMLTILDDRQQLGFALGATEYLVKPVDRDRLLRLLDRHCPVAVMPTALVIDDDVSVRDLLRRHLEREGWDVVDAENGITGLAALQAKKPDLILLDLMMPEMDGFEFIESLITHPKWCDIPIVVITAKMLTEEESRRLHSAAASVIEKAHLDHDAVLSILNIVTHHAHKVIPQLEEARHE